MMAVLLQRLLPSLACIMVLGDCADHGGTCLSSRCADDDQIRLAVVAKIDAQSALKLDHLRVEVTDGTLYLYGLVDTQRELFAAETAARGVPGVTRLVNAIAVNNPPY